MITELRIGYTLIIKKETKCYISTILDSQGFRTGEMTLKIIQSIRNHVVWWGRWISIKIQ